MAEFLHIEEIPLDEITDIYINELQLKFNTMLESFKKAIIPADKMEFTITRELSFVIDLRKKIDRELDVWGGIDNTPLPEVNRSITYFEYLVIHSTADDLGLAYLTSKTAYTLSWDKDVCSWTTTDREALKSVLTETQQ
jgi:hypothetical protein